MQSNTAFFNNNYKRTKRPEAENKNSILNKFRIELNKSQSIITKELIRSKELKMKFLKKRKKQQAEEEAKQLLLKNSPQNLNLINIQNNIINNSTGFKHKTNANLNESQNKRNETPQKNVGWSSDNNTTAKKKINNSKEDFFATEVKINHKSTIKNPLSPNKDRKFMRSGTIDIDVNDNMNYNNNYKISSKINNGIIHNEIHTELNKSPTKDPISRDFNKK